MAREIAPANQWPVKEAPTARASYRMLRIIDDPVRPGFVTFADAGADVAFLVDDPDRAGFVTPETTAAEEDAAAVAMLVGGSRAIIVGT